MDDKTPEADGEGRSLGVAQLSEMARAGIASARARDYENGYLLLGEVCDRMRAAGEKLPAHVISFYGLCLALNLGKHREASQLCQAAIEAEPMKADYYANLAEVCGAARQRRKAVTAIHRGLAIDPASLRLLELETRLGRRRDPVVSSLDRTHPVNVTLGRIRHAFAGPPRSSKRETGKKKAD
jgi:tetratricopeptide (TPR) repeat protein